MQPLHETIRDLSAHFGALPFDRPDRARDALRAIERPLSAFCSHAERRGIAGENAANMVAALLDERIPDEIAVSARDRWQTAVLQLVEAICRAERERAAAGAPDA